MSRLTVGEFDDGLDPECEFCRIIRGEESARVVCETETTLAFFPLKPAVLGHTLLIPKVHVPDLWTSRPDLGPSLMEDAIRVGKALKVALRPDGLNMITSAGEAASQTVFHLHLHLVPRWLNDRIGNIWPPAEGLSEEVKDEVADLVREACEGQ
jgi:histidine triad (HIT) family protein